MLSINSRLRMPTQPSTARVAEEVAFLHMVKLGECLPVAALTRLARLTSIRIQITWASWAWYQRVTGMQWYRKQLRMRLHHRSVGTSSSKTTSRTKCNSCHSPTCSPSSRSILAQAWPPTLTVSLPTDHSPIQIITPSETFQIVVELILDKITPWEAVTTSPNSSNC